jgi:alpha-tubulin suppressor-like RCC1 family protein
VVCQSDYNLALTEAGQVFAWGSAEGQAETVWNLGRALEPTLVVALSNQIVCQIAAGEYHCAAVTEGEALFTRGTQRHERHVEGEPIPELGYGRVAREFGEPHRVLALEGMRITSVAVGNDFTVAVTEAGAVTRSGVATGDLGMDSARTTSMRRVGSLRACTSQSASRR